MRQNVITLPFESLHKLPATTTKKNVKAVYVPTPYGYKLARIQKFSVPTFVPAGYESRSDGKSRDIPEILNECSEEEKLRRSLRRAKQNAFDLVLSNPDLDTFCTFTYAPDSVEDKNSYDDCYEKLKTWLSNAVQRRNHKYVLVPERHKSGAIHFHSICNRDSLDLVLAYNANNGRPLTHNGKPIYNVNNWKYGFSTAEKISDSTDDREAVSKYIFKYMGKQNGEKIGGRFFLHGGDLQKPFCCYGDSEEEFFADASNRPTYQTENEVLPGVTYWEWDYI